MLWQKSKRKIRYFLKFTNEKPHISARSAFQRRTSGKGLRSRISVYRLIAKALFITFNLQSSYPSFKIKCRIRLYCRCCGLRYRCSVSGSLHFLSCNGRCNRIPTFIGIPVIIVILVIHKTTFRQQCRSFCVLQHIKPLGILYTAAPDV